MATANKILGQVSPAADTLTALYTVPAATQANVNIFVCNTSFAITTFRIAIVKSGGSVSTEEYIAYDTEININYPIDITGISLAAGDFIRVYATLNTVTFTAMGIEIS
jgi:hypothetical protein